MDATNWKAALESWRAAEETENRKKENGTQIRGKIPVGWWEAAFKDQPTQSDRQGHKCGAREMLMLVAYDIADHKRLARVARHCEDHGVRVQYSVFECRLEAEAFERFWIQLTDLIDPSVDRLVAYRICLECAREVHESGVMVTTSPEKPVAYIF